MIQNQRLAGLIIILALAAASCGGSHSQPAPPPASGKMNFGYLRYDSAALEYRLDSLHNRGLILQFCLREAGNNNTAFQLIAYAFDTLNDYNNSWMPDTLRLVSDSIPKTFSGKITIGNNEVTREQLLNAVRDKQGNRFSYDYLLFTPVVENVFNHVVYRMKPVKNGRLLDDGATQVSSPMPPTRIW